MENKLLETVSWFASLVKFGGICYLAYLACTKLGIGTLFTRMSGRAPGFRAWVKANPWWTVGIAVVLWVCLTNWPITSSVLAYITTGPVKGVFSTREGPVQHDPSAITQGKSVGGPLRWSTDAKVKLRNRVNPEKVDARGVYFVGIIPPSSWTDVVFSSYEGGKSWNAFLIDIRRTRRFLDSSTLQLISPTAKDVPSGVIHSAQLAKTGKELKYLKNFPHQHELCEVYGQLTGHFPDSIDVDVEKKPENLSQYELQVGVDEVIVIPPSNFKWLWIAPVHHQCYQSKFLGVAIPSKGMYVEEAQRLVSQHQPTLRAAPELVGDGYDEMMPFQAILLEQGGTMDVLSEAVLLQREDTRGPISLRLNIPKGEQASALVTAPAKVIVGIQL